MKKKKRGMILFLSEANFHIIDKQSGLSISFEVDVPTGKVGGSLLFKHQRHEFPRGVWGHAPQKILKVRCLKCYFQCFLDSIWALKTIKIKTILTIFYVYYNRSFPQNRNHSEWLLEKSEMINLQMLIQKQYIQCFKFMLSFLKTYSAQQCMPLFLWRGSQFGTCESLGSSPVKMSQAFHDPSICFIFSYFHRKVNTFKTPEMCLYLDPDV